MRRKHSFIWVVAVAGLLSLFGCSGTPGDNTDVKKLQADLKDAKGQNEVLQKDNAKLNDSLKQAESSLAETKDAQNKLQLQVDELTAKINELSTARTDLQSKVDALSGAKTDLEKKVADLAQSRDGLEKKVADLTQSRDGLQKNVETLTVARGNLQKQVDDLSKARNAALEDAQNAEGKIDQLNNKLKVQTQQMAELQDQIVNIRTVLDHLQQNLK